MRERPRNSFSAMRAFGPSAAVTIIAVGAVAAFAGTPSALVTAILVAVEVAFSFDNAVVNAKIVGKLSAFWRMIFLTAGMVIAVLGMRVVFPIVLVMLTAHQSWSGVVRLALHDPHGYATKLASAHPLIAAFGGAFLLMLALQFFTDGRRNVLWFRKIERGAQRLSAAWMPPLATACAVAITAAVPANHHPSQTVVAGACGIAAFICIKFGVGLLGKAQTSSAGGIQTGAAAFATFVYLEILDASFSFDSVLGAFAITSKIVLIAVGLGVGAFWVRSLTIFMVRRGTLKSYIFLEHGAHYTIVVLGLLLLASVVFDVPDMIAGLAGLGFIGASIVASRRALAVAKS